MLDVVAGISLFDPQGDNFQLNVVDNLTNETMLTATTVVRVLADLVRTSVNVFSSSTGMASSKGVQTGLMVLPL